MNDTEYSNYYCTAEWHLARLRDKAGRRAPFAAILYPFAFRISKKSRRFHCSAVNVAQHFGVSAWTVLRAIEALRIEGLFLVMRRVKFGPTEYRVVRHDEWAKAHPGRCAVRTAATSTGARR